MGSGHQRRSSAGGARGSKRSDAAEWRSHTDRFLGQKRTTGEVGETWLSRMRWELGRFPGLIRRVGLRDSLRAPADVRRDHILAMREKLPWATPTFAIHFQALRQCLRWAGNPIAADRSLWRLPSGAPVHRRWLTRDQLVALFRSSRGVERVIVVLEGFAGLRRVEVLRLRVKDVLVNEGCLRILGKGRHGGKWRNIPLQGEVDRVLKAWIQNRRPDERLVPLSRSGADAALQRAARRSGLSASGIKVSHHDLRRTFGRLANASGMSLISLQGLYGHASPDLSAHYIGLDFDELRSALARMGTYLSSGRSNAKDSLKRTVPQSTTGRYSHL